MIHFDDFHDTRLAQGRQDHHRILIYLGSPYSHPDKDVMCQRWMMAVRAAAHLQRLGYTVFSPIAHNHPCAEVEELPHSWDWWKLRDTRMIEASNVFCQYRLDGWQSSVGLTDELIIATKLGKDITYLL